MVSAGIRSDHLSLIIGHFADSTWKCNFDFVLAPEERDVYSTKRYLVISLRKERNVSAGETR